MIKKPKRKAPNRRKVRRIRRDIANEFDTPGMDQFDRLSDEVDADEVSGEVGERHLRLRGN
jgi:hypothetical protein